MTTEELLYLQVLVGTVTWDSVDTYLVSLCYGYLDLMQQHCRQISFHLTTLAKITLSEVHVTHIVRVPWAPAA